MTFNWVTILVFVAAAVLTTTLLPPKWREWVLFVGSMVIIYWLQPVLPIRFSGFIFPTAILALTVLCWWLTQQPQAPDQEANRRQNMLALTVLIALVIGLSFFRFIDVDYRFMANRPPTPLSVTASLAVFGLVTTGSFLFLRERNGRLSLTFTTLLLIILFVVMKTELPATAVSRFWRLQTNQDSSLAGMIDLNWIGFSYITFRLIHTLRDQQSGILPALSLREYVTYVIFFPTFVAGPIDRAERFVTDLRALPVMKGPDALRYYTGLQRICWGLLKKFVIADLLAQGAALTPLNAMQTHSAAGLWLLLYGYALRLYFDFSGYTDIAIGIGLVMGMQLPENFKRPYLTTNITTFWQSWHITLSDWVRFYVFSPLSRTLLRRKPRPPAALIVLATQITTMVAIGLWHGVTWSFLIWGLWHGLGLFVHKQWSTKTRRLYRKVQANAWQRRAWSIAAWLLTFHFVTLGWVWFALPDVALAVRTMARLFGLR